MLGIKKRARSADDYDDMINKEEPQAKQSRETAQGRLDRFQRANSNSHAVSNTGIGALNGNVFSDIRAIAHPPQQQLANATNVYAANVVLFPAGADDMNMDMEGDMEMES